MEMSFETSFQYLLKWEGGYGNDAHDAGGATNLGVIQEEYDRYRDGKELSRQSVKYISKNEAKEIYKLQYWDKTRCGELDEGVANCLFDADVNSGDSRGVQWLQKAINSISGKEAVSVDKVCGPKTISAANGLPPSKLIDEMLDLRLAFMHVAKNSKTGERLWPFFGRGWSRRIDGVRIQSHALAGARIHPSTEKKEIQMSDLAKVLDLAKVVAPLLVPALEKGNPLFGLAVGMLSTALQTTEDALPSTVAAADTGTLAAALKVAEADLKVHAKAAAELTGQPPTTSAPPVGDPYVDPIAAVAKYAIGVISVAIMVHLGMSVDTANGIAANIGPTIWTGLSGALTAVMGWLLHRSIVGANLATTQIVKKA